MPVEYRTGDLFQQTDLAAISQGNNAGLKWGRGIAPVFKRIWPRMYEEFCIEINAGRLTLGDVFPWQAPSGVWIYNMVTQPRPGPCATLTAIEHALTLSLDHAIAHGVSSLGMPRIGAGLGGLAWEDVNAVVNRVAGQHTVRVVCVSQPDAPPLPH